MCTYPILSFVSYNHLSSSSCFLFTTLELVTIHKTVKKALFHPGWRAAMQKEMVALDDNGTWGLIPLPFGKNAIGCK